MQLRHTMLDATKDKTTEERANALNILEMIIDGNHSIDDMVNAIESDTVPVVYKPKSSE